jgi:hypothetical protein
MVKSSHKSVKCAFSWFRVAAHNVLDILKRSRVRIPPTPPNGIRDVRITLTSLILLFEYLQVVAKAAQKGLLPLLCSIKGVAVYAKSNNWCYHFFVNARAWQKHQQKSQVKALAAQHDAAVYASAQANTELSREQTRYSIRRAAQLDVHNERIRAAIALEVENDPTLNDTIKYLEIYLQFNNAKVRRVFDWEDPMGFGETVSPAIEGIEPLPPHPDFKQQKKASRLAQIKMMKAGRAFIQAARALERIKLLKIAIRNFTQKTLGQLEKLLISRVLEIRKPCLPLEQRPQTSPNSPNASI